MRILVSACLLGLPCRYDGASRPNAAVMALAQAHELVPVCPECYGGLPTPRPPAERVGERVLNALGEDVTAQYQRGAAAAVELCRLLQIRLAVLKAKSPACGCGQIYDGSFSGTLVSGDGVAAQALQGAGVRVVTEAAL